MVIKIVWFKFNLLLLQGQLNTIAANHDGFFGVQHNSIHTLVCGIIPMDMLGEHFLQPITDFTFFLVVFTYRWIIGQRIVIAIVYRFI